MSLLPSGILIAIPNVVSTCEGTDYYDTFRFSSISSKDEQPNLLIILHTFYHMKKNYDYMCHLMTVLFTIKKIPTYYSNKQNGTLVAFFVTGISGTNALIILGTRAQWFPLTSMALADPWSYGDCHNLLGF
ncbi:hypothetical protein ACJX0J_035547 [Zea mays]